MAGRGPAPQAIRRRRNEPARGDWIDLPPLEQPVLPKLVTRKRGEERWSPRARAIWEAWRQDPVTAMFSAADIAYALDTIAIFDKLAPSELRLRMDGLGLTPKGKRDLRWRVTDSDDPETGPTKPAPSGSGRRARLSVVK